jgi:hypothetical protein
MRDASRPSQTDGARRLYINYDAKFRGAAQSHQGTFGVAFKW